MCDALSLACIDGLSPCARRSLAGQPLTDIDAQRAAAGDRAAFARLYHAHVAMVHSLARRMLDAGEADDATQDVFIRVWEKLPLYEPDGRFGAWLHRVALNLILRRREEMQRPVRRGSDVDLDVVTARSKASDVGIDLDAALRRLPTDMRDVVVLHDMEGYSHEEIARQLAISVASSKMRLHRARLALRAFMK